MRILILLIALVAVDKPLTGVEETCDAEYEECVKYCAENPEEKGCILECKLDNDHCYKLP